MVGTTMETKNSMRLLRADIHLEQTFPHPRAKVWRALTEPALMQKWGMRPEGFAPVVGTRFKLIDDGEHKGWRGFVECEVLAVEHERLLKTSWVGDEKDADHPHVVTYALHDAGTGCRLTLDHEGFRGVGGFLTSKLFLGPGWKSLLRKRLAEILASF